MGGRGSGRFGCRGGRATTRDALRIAIGDLLHGRLMHNVGYLVLPDDHVLINFFGRRIFEAGITITRQGHGALHRWFACPDCDRRCRLLYLRDGRLACRQCHRLIYASQLESHGSRKLRKALHHEWRLDQVSRMLSGAQSGAVSGKVISANN